MATFIIPRKMPKLSEFQSPKTNERIYLEYRKDLITSNPHLLNEDGTKKGILKYMVRIFK